MAIDRLILSNFRNISNADLFPSPHLNFIYGVNGSGKTSVLEALSTLALGRSFRTQKFRNIIRYEQSEMSLFCHFTQNNEEHRTGILRKRVGASIFKLDGNLIPSSSHLAELLPLQVINSDSFQLLTGGPSERRKFLDWLVFHVKHNFHKDWPDYSRVLKQRNSLLRSVKLDALELATWDTALAELGGRLDCARQGMVEEFKLTFLEYAKELEFIDADLLTVEYIKGWEADLTLEESLHLNQLRDIKVGYTSRGPHKCDIKVNYNGQAVNETFSRGQLKSLIIAMFHAQMHCFNAHRQVDCILLIDDLPAELDSSNLKLLLSWLSTYKAIQVFLTGIKLSDIHGHWSEDKEQSSKVFHVKHGEITEQ